MMSNMREQLRQLDKEQLITIILELRELVHDQSARIQALEDRLVKNSTNRSKSGKHPVRFAQEQVARGSRLTPLISRLLAESGIAPLVQRGLFDESPPPRSANNTDDSAADSPPDEGTEPGGPPPYRWG